MTIRKTFTLCALMLTTSGIAQPTVTQHTFTVHDGLAANVISGMAQDRHGLMWIATWNGLCCYDGQQFTTFRGGPRGSDNALSSNRITMIEPDSRDNIWVRTYDGGLYLLDTRECRFVNVGSIVERRYGKRPLPRNFYAMPSGHTWITDENGELNLRIDDSHPTDINHIEVLGKMGKPIQGNIIHKVEADSEGREWIVTDRSTTCYNNKASVRKPLTTVARQHDAARLDSLLARCGVGRKDIDKHYIDRQGNLWYSTANGLTLATFREQPFHLLPLREQQPTRSVTCRRDGTTWAGTADGYIAIYNGHTLTGWLDHAGHISSRPVRFSDRIFTLYEDSEGTLWIGTKGQGLYTVSRQGRVSHYRADTANRYAISHDYIYDINDDGNGRLWIATYGGGVNMADGQGDEALRFIHSGNELKGYPEKDFQRVRRITHDRKGTMLLSTTSGLVNFTSGGKRSADIRFYTTRHRQADSTSLLSSDVMQTLAGSKGNVYVTTMGGGIQQIDGKLLPGDNLRLTDLPVLNQEPANALWLAEDSKGYVWIGRENGVECYHPDSGKLLRFGGNSMPPGIELTEAKPAADGQGALWVGTVGGVLTFKGDDIKLSNYRPGIVFTSVQYQGENATHPLLYGGTLTIPPERRNLTVSFAALDYGDNSLIQYAYKIKESSKEWSYIGRHPSIAFNQLAPGRHTLVVKSTNADGVWADNETELTLDVTPRPWERTWVQLLLLIVVVVLSTWAVMAWMNHRRRNRKREQRLESIMRQYRELQESIAAQQEEHAADRQQEHTDDKPEQPLHKYTLEEPKIVDEDEVMMNQLMQFIEQRIGDEALKIDEMAEAVNMGRTVFFGKMKSLVGMSPSDFLRQVRMQRAQQLLARSKMSISEVAYSIGFTDPKYFTKCFKKDTGMTPSEYRAKS